MPIVSATDVPYGPGLVGNLPQAPTQVPGDYQQIPTEPAMFGALQGQALEKVGTTLETASDRLAARAIEAQTLHNEISAHGAANWTQDESTKLLWGTGPDDLGLFSLKGQAALDASPKIRDQLTKLYADARNNLQNPRQQLIYDNETRRNLSWQLSKIGEHYATQQQAAAQAADKAKYDANKLGLGAAFGDPAGEALRVKGMMEAGLAELSRSGSPMTPDAINTALGTVRRDFTEEKAKNLGTQDPGQAYKYVQENKDVLADKYPALNDHFRARTIDEVARGAANTGLSGGAGGGPAGKGVPLIDYTPATGVLEGTGLSGKQYDIYRRTTASEEAPSYNTPPSANPYGYMGLYQMGGRETAAIRKGEDFNEIAKAAKRLGIPEPTTQEFLSNPKLQEQLFENYTLNNHNELMQRVPQYRDGSPEERAALLMGAHIGGVGGVIRYLNSGGKDDPSDRHRSVGDYIKIMRGAMASGGPAVNVITHTPTPGTAGTVGSTAPGPQAAAAPTTATDGGGAPAPTTEPAPPGAPTTAPSAPARRTLAEVEDVARTEAARGAAAAGLNPADTQKTIDNATTHARSQYGAILADEERARRQRLEDVRAEDERSRHQIYQKMFPQGDPANAPTVSASEIANAPLMTAETGPVKGGLTAETQQTLLSFALARNKADTLKAISERNSLEFFKDIHRPDGDPQKITDTGVIDQARIDGKLDWADMDKLRKEILDRRTTEGERLSTSKKDFLTAFESQIDHSNPLMQKIDWRGKEQFYKFKTDVEQRILEYQRDKKNPFLLFQPGTPDYLGKPENIDRYLLPIEESLRNLPRALGLPATPAPAPSPVVKPPLSTLIPPMPPKPPASGLGPPVVVPVPPATPRPEVPLR